MHKIVVFIFFLVSSTICYSQSNRTDSLKNEMDRYTKKDTIRIKKIIDYSHSLYETNPDKTILVVKEALELAKELNWEKGRIDILLGLASMLTDQQKFDEAISYSLEALKLSAALSYPHISDTCKVEISGLSYPHISDTCKVEISGFI